MRDNSFYVCVLENIVKYSNYISELHEKYEYNQKYFCGDMTEVNEYSLSVNMCVMQIGELVKKLDAGFRDKYPGANWRGLAGLRDHIAHAYGSLNFDITWEVSTEEIPALNDYVKEILENNFRNKEE